MDTVYAFPGSATAPPPGTLSSAHRCRREYVQGEISGLCASRPGLRVLCVGLAALRDLESLSHRISGAGGEVVVLERNEERAGIYEQDNSESGVAIVPGELWRAQSAEFGRFDFIYAPNLLTSLPDAQAKRAIARFTVSLRRTGRILLSSYSTEMRDSGYPVNVTYTRSEKEVVLLSDHIPDACSTGQFVWRDESGLIIFVEIHR